MERKRLAETDIKNFEEWLVREEKSAATLDKYIRDVKALRAFAGNRPLSRDLVREWKASLEEREYAASSINSMLASVNSLLGFLGREDCRVKNLKVQRQTYCSEEKELTRSEYERLLEAAKEKPRLRLIMETICGTGIRVSELRYFTAEAVRAGEVRVHNKGKIRVILIPGKLRKKLLSWAKKQGIKSGPVFTAGNGRPISRGSIWAQMKRLCASAGVSPGKVFPHNLRKLFARVFYNVRKDIARLADVLGHSSINTTRLYLMTSGGEHRRILDRMGLVR